MKKDRVSSDGFFRIKFVGHYEPNSGRQLWLIAVFLKNNDITSKLFGSNQVPINFHIDNWVLESKNLDYVYVPVEGSAKLYNRTSGKIIDLPYKGISTALFLGNYFTGNQLVEVYTDEVVITNLIDSNNKKIAVDDSEYEKWCRPNSHEGIVVRESITAKIRKFAQFLVNR